MVGCLETQRPASIGGVGGDAVSSLDGVKDMDRKESWLLIRPSGTEPVLRVYAEAPEPGMVDALLSYGRSLAET